MALREHSKVDLSGGAYRIYKWEGGTNGGTPDTFEPIQITPHADVTVFAFGTFGASAAIALHGSPEVVNPPTLFAALSDAAGTVIALGAAGAAVIGPKAAWYKPVLTDGDGSTDIDIYLVAVG